MAIEGLFSNSKLKVCVIIYKTYSKSLKYFRGKKCLQITEPNVFNRSNFCVLTNFSLNV